MNIFFSFYFLSFCFGALLNPVLEWKCFRVIHALASFALSVYVILDLVGINILEIK